MKYSLQKHLLLSLACLGAFSFAASTAQAATLNDTTTLQDQQPPNDIPVAQPQFTKVIDDLPLMDGLNLVPDNDVLFVVPKAGRIAETDATGVVDVDAVYNYYRKALPHLGWKAINGRSYVRENDILHIDAHADGKLTTVKFSVTPLNDTK